MSKLVDSTSDPAIPTLAAVLDPAALVKQLRMCEAPRRQWDLSQGVRVIVLKWKRASRCTFEIALKNASGWEEKLIGKVYAEDRIDIYQTMEELQQAGFGSEQEFGIPCPIAFIAPLRLLLYEKVPGTRARTLIVGPSGTESVNAVERCARWLAHFQAEAPRRGSMFRAQDYLGGLEAWFLDWGKSELPFVYKAKNLTEQLNAAARHLEGTEMCAGHGTYTCGQVLLTERRTVTIDWDTFNLTDPSHDVARFLVDLQRMALKYFGSLNALDQAAEVFLKTYANAAGSYDATSLAFYRAAICLERARSDANKQNPGWRARAEMMLDEGLGLLQRDKVG